MDESERGRGWGWGREEEWWGGGHGLERRHGGLKKQSLGFGGRSGACSRPPLPPRRLVFLGEDAAVCRRLTGMSGDRAQEASACIFLVLA